MLNSTVPAGSRIRLQKDPANTTTYAIDFINTEQVAPIANPDPARYAVPAGFSQQDVQSALDRVRMDPTGTLLGVYLPAGNYTAQQKFLIYQKGIRVTGAGPWYTRILAPANQENSDIGFDLQTGASGTTVSNLAVFGNYTDRPGPVADLVREAGLPLIAQRHPAERLGRSMPTRPALSRALARADGTDVFIHRADVVEGQCLRPQKKRDTER